MKVLKKINSQSFISLEANLLFNSIKISTYEAESCFSMLAKPEMAISLLFSISL